MYHLICIIPLVNWAKNNTLANKLIYNWAQMPPLKQEDRRVWRYILYVVGEVLSD